MGKAKNMAKNRRGITWRSRVILKPRGSVRSKGGVQKPDSWPNKLRHVHGIVHNGKSSGHTAVFDTGAQKSIILRYGWEIIKRHDYWIDARGIDLGGPPKSGRRLQLVDARGVVKNLLDGKSYLIIIRRAFFNPNSDETLLDKRRCKISLITLTNLTYAQ